MPWNDICETDEAAKAHEDGLPERPADATVTIVEKNGTGANCEYEE